MNYQFGLHNPTPEFLGILVALIGVWFVLTVLSIIGMWNIFSKKLGIAGWKSIVPIYSAYLLSKKIFGEDYGYVGCILATTTFLMAFQIGIILSPLLLIATLWFDWKFIERLGGGVGIYLATVFFPFITLPIIAFSPKYQYKGPTNKLF